MECNIRFGGEVRDVLVCIAQQAMSKAITLSPVASLVQVKCASGSSQ